MTADAPLTADELAAINARETAAMPGPWHLALRGEEVVDARGYEVADIYCIGESPELRSATAAFIAHARTDVPRLVARVQELEEFGRLSATLVGSLAEIAANGSPIDRQLARKALKEHGAGVVALRDTR